MPPKKILIVQTSPMHTASTFLVNLLYGFICKKRNVIFDEAIKKNKFKENINIIKSHRLNIDKIIQLYSNDYNLYFICSERPEYDLYIDEKYKTYKNVLVFQFSELLESETNKLDNIINSTYDKLYTFLPKHVNLSKENAKNRIIEMNKLC
jgi:hypothetical protein